VHTPEGSVRVMTTKSSAGMEMKESRFVGRSILRRSREKRQKKQANGAGRRKMLKRMMGNTLV
jgi:hypothetical protein